MLINYYINYYKNVKLLKRANLRNLYRVFARLKYKRLIYTLYYEKA